MRIWEMMVSGLVDDINMRNEEYLNEK